LPELESEKHKVVLQPENILSQWLEHHISIREFLIKYLVKAHSFAMACTFLILFFQGFQLWGFNLDKSILKFVGGALALEVFALLLIVFYSLFVKKNNLRNN
jgi:hypothetical protein